MRRVLGGLFICAAVAIVGCNTEVGRITLKGKVTLDDKIIDTGVVEFEPVDGKSPTSKDGRIVNGEYTAQVVPGEVIVRIRSAEIIGKKKMYDTPESPWVDDVRERIPKKYNEESTFKKTIEPNQRVMDLHITSK